MDEKRVSIPEDLFNLMLMKAGPSIIEAYNELKESDSTQLKKAITDAFTVDKSKGEGRPGIPELSHRKDMMDLRHKLYKDIRIVVINKDKTVESKVNEVDKLCFDFGMKLKTMNLDYIEKTRENALDTVAENMKKIGVTFQRPPQPKEVLTAFMKWQAFKSVKMGEEIRLDITDRILGTNYFSVAYGK